MRGSLKIKYAQSKLSKTCSDAGGSGFVDEELSIFLFVSKREKINYLKTVCRCLDGIGFLTSLEDSTRNNNKLRRREQETVEKRKRKMGSSAKFL